MATLKNEGTCSHALPTRSSPDGSSAFAVTIAAGESADVPDWYVDELRAEKGVAALFDRDGGGIRATSSESDAGDELGSDDLEIEDDEADLGDPTAPKATKKKKRTR